MTVLPPKLIIFDCDGVLVDTEVIANRQIAAVLSKLGPPITGHQLPAINAGNCFKARLCSPPLYHLMI